MEAIVFAVVVLGILAWAAWSGPGKWTTPEETEQEEALMDMNRIGITAMELRDKMDEHLPANAELVAVGICAEVRWPCPDGGDHMHTAVVPLSTTDSDVHGTALFELAAENVGSEWDLEEVEH